MQNTSQKLSTLKKKIQTKDVVPTAAIVPVGIAFEASAKSPDRFEPAIIPDKNTNVIYQ